MKADRVIPVSAARRSQRGATLLEALIGFLVVAIGWLGAAQMQVRLRQGADLARQQAEAGRLAQQRLEQLRADAATATGATLSGQAASGAASTSTIAAGDTEFRLETKLRAHAASSLTDATVSVHWLDAAGAEQRVVLSGAVEAQSAALVLPLTVAPGGRQAGPVVGRHAAIPRDAADLGDGRSIFRPARGNSVVWLFDNRSARIVARCSIGPEVTPAQLASADLSGCHAQAGLLLAGRLRSAPEAGTGALPAEVVLRRPDGSAAAAECLSEPVRIVDVGSARAPRAIAVGIDAVPAEHGLAGWNELDDRFVRYHCAVVPERPAGSRRPRWSGRAAIEPAGWIIGREPGSWRICRHSIDSDASGAIDRPAEAPEVYRAVEEPLVEQNHLIVPGAQACPDAAGPAGAVTVPHQP